MRCVGAISQPSLVALEASVSLEMKWANNWP